MWGLAFAAATRRACLVAAAWVSFAAAPAVAQTIDFTELPANTRADGATVKGVTFKYTVNGVASPDATFTTTGPGPTSITKPPNLEAGTPGILSLSFATPVRDFGFSYVTLYPSANANGLTVTLFDQGGGTTSKNLPISVVGPYSGGRFDFTAVSPFTRVTIDPNQALGPRFVIDDVTFTPVPEPGTAGLCAIAAMAACLRRPRRAAPAA